MLKRMSVLVLALLLCMGLATGASGLSAKRIDIEPAADEPIARGIVESTIVSASYGYWNEGSTGIIQSTMMVGRGATGGMIITTVQRRNTGNGEWKFFRNFYVLDMNSRELGLRKEFPIEPGYQYRALFDFYSYGPYGILDHMQYTSNAYWYY